MSEKELNEYEETNIESVNIPLEFYKRKNEDKKDSYQHLSTVLSMGNIEFFTLTVIIGKLIVKKRDPIDGGTEQFFKMTKKILAKDEMTILKAIAVDEVKNPYILKDQIAMRKIWMEYSYAGFKKINEWYKNNELYQKLHNIMIFALKNKTPS